MTVHALIPVFNRLPMTRAILGYLRLQKVDEPIVIIVVNDGSSDGTAQFLEEQSDVIALQGDGSLWWGGAIDMGLRHVFGTASERDWVLFLNNDTAILPDFVQALLDTARRTSPSAVGSVVRDTRPSNRLLSLGPRIDPWRLCIKDMLEEFPSVDDLDIITVDALSGRGTLYPVSALRHVNGMRVHWLPHYLADYELALRVRAAGWRLLVCTTAVTFSLEDYGSTKLPSNFWGRLFSVRSPVFIPARIRFWWSASSVAQRLTLPLRAFIRRIYLFARRDE